MKPIDNLFIRACKSQYPRKRLYSVYCRFFTRYFSKEECAPSLVNLLSNIITDNEIKFNLANFISEISPESHFDFEEEEYNYWEACLSKLISILQLTPKDELISKGYRIPRMFRK